MQRAEPSYQIDTRDEISFSVDLGQGKIVRTTEEANASTGVTLQRRLFVLLDEPDSSPLAALIGFGILMMIFLSSLCFVAETTEWAKSQESVQDVMYAVEIVCIAGFSVEYVTKLACCTHRLSPNPSVIKCEYHFFYPALF